MKIQQIRNATIKVYCAGKCLLIDPWFQKKGTGLCAPSPDPEKAKLPSPSVELPFSVEEIMADVDAIVVTHIHPDHFDPETASMLDKAIPVFASDAQTKSQIERFGYASVSVLPDDGTAFGGVTPHRTDAMHGPAPERTAGAACGVILTAPEEPTLYIAGDSVYYDGVQRALTGHQPDVIVLNACGAEMMGIGRLIMDAEDVWKVCQAAPNAAVVASHMGAVNHAAVTRDDLRRYLTARGAINRVHIPADGETLAFSLPR